MPNGYSLQQFARNIIADIGCSFICIKIWRIRLFARGGGEDKLRQLNQAYYSGDGSLIENFFSINRKLAFYQERTCFSFIQNYNRKLRLYNCNLRLHNQKLRLYNRSLRLQILCYKKTFYFMKGEVSFRSKGIQTIQR